MSLPRVGYRLRQFWQALLARPEPEDLALARQTLTPPQLALFQQLQASEQAHALQVFSQLRVKDKDQPDLLAATLLHDVGKARHRLRIWERVVIVLAKASSPARAQRWGGGLPRGWRRPFVIARQHPFWGAEMAAQAGASPLAQALIRRHQDPLPGEAKSLEDRLLQKLQAVDNET